MIENGSIQSAHDCSDGGLAVALAECCFAPLVGKGSPLGADLQLDAAGLRTDALLFGETPSRIVLSVSPNAAPNVLSLAKEYGVAASEIGYVGGDSLRIRVDKAPETQIDFSISDLFEKWNNKLEYELTNNI